MSIQVMDFPKSCEVIGTGLFKRSMTGWIGSVTAWIFPRIGLTKRLKNPPRLSCTLSKESCGTSPGPSPPRSEKCEPREKSPDMDGNGEAVRDPAVSLKEHSTVPDRLGAITCQQSR